MDTKDIKLPIKKDTMDIDRKNMPQVASKDISDFIRYVTKNNIKVTKKIVDPAKLKATQGQFHKKKIADLIAGLDDSNYKQKPIIVSKDMYILDGHHRWLAHVNAGKDIEVYHVDLPINDLLDKVREYPKSFTQKLYECLDLLSEEDNSCPLETFISEAFNTKLKWKESITTSGEQKIYEFTANVDGSEIKLTIDDEPGEVAEIYFERDGRMDVTNQGSASIIFGAVLNKMFEWLKKQPKKPKQIYFTAQDPKKDSRESLYDKMIKRYAGKLGYSSRKFKVASMNHSSYYLDLKG